MVYKEGFLLENLLKNKNESMAPMTLIEVLSVSFTGNGQKILENINFSLGPRDFVTLIGPNGAGKSTLLKIIIGCLTPSKGKVLLNPQARIGYMPQRLSLNEMVPLDVVTFLKTARDKTLFERIIHQTGIACLLHRSLHALSGGELQRVLLSRALLGQPNLLLLDEPAQSLDIEGQAQFYRLLEEFRRETSLAVLMVSHDLNFVHQASDQVICLNRHICCHGKPEEVQNSIEYKALFPQAGVVTIRPYRHSHDHTHDCFSQTSSPESAPHG